MLELVLELLFQEPEKEQPTKVNPTAFSLQKPLLLLRGEPNTA